jgi:hypothetical protein
MKKLIVAALLVLSQLSHAQVREVKRMTTEQARARVERSTTYLDIVKAREAGKDITADAKLMERINKMLDLSLKDLVSLTASENNNLIKLMNVNAKDILTEVARLSSIAKDSASTAQEKAMAKKSLELVSKAAHDVESLAVNSAQAQKQKEKVAKIIEISGKISSLDFGQSSKTFVQKYEKALTEGKSVNEAVKIASNGKFTEKELRECE